MSEVRKTETLREAVIKRVERPRYRSPLFWFLMENFDAVRGAAVGAAFRWSELCEEFAKHGCTDRTGKPASPKRAKKTWDSVRKEKARIEAARLAKESERAVKAAANPRRNMPSKFPKKEYGPPLAVISGKVASAPESKFWNKDYMRDEEGYITPVNPEIHEHKCVASAARCKQERNEKSDRPRDLGIENLIGKRQGVNE